MKKILLILSILLMFVGTSYSAGYYGGDTPTLAVIDALFGTTSGATLCLLTNQGSCVAPAGTGDMLLAGPQTVTGAKTFGDALLIATTPKIITGLKDTNGNKWIGITPTTTAVDYLNITNAATGGHTVGLSVAGTDTDVSLAITGKGTGTASIDGNAANALAFNGHNDTFFQQALTYPVTGVASPTAGKLVKWGASGNTIVDAFAYGTLTDTDLCTYTIANGFQCTTAASTYLLSGGTAVAASNLIFTSDAQDDIPVRGATVYGRVTIAEQTIVGRITGGHVTGLSTAQIKTLLGYYTSGDTITGTLSGNSSSATKSTNLAGGNGTTHLGYIPYQSAADATSFINNTVASRKFLQETGDGTNGGVPSFVALQASDIPAQNVDIAGFAWGGGTASIATNLGKLCRHIQFSATITSISVRVAPSASATIALYKDAYSDSTEPTTDMTGGNNVVITAKMGMLDSTLTGWTGKAVSAGDDICASLTANDYAAKVNLILHGTRP